MEGGDAEQSNQNSNNNNSADLSQLLPVTITTTTTMGTGPTRIQTALFGDTARGTLVITIGPQCAGKTTILKTSYPHVIDIAIDDHPGLNTPSKWSTLGATTQARIVWDAVVNVPEADFVDSKSLWIPRLFNAIPAKGLSPEIRTTLAKGLYEAILAVKRENIAISETYDSMNFNELTPAIASSQKRLEDAMAQGQAIAWGNTNKLLTDMYSAVMTAEKHQYNVEFLILHGATLQELLTRNVRRGMLTGKYIPVEVVYRTKEDVEKLIREGISIDRIKATNGERPGGGRGRGGAGGRGGSSNTSRGGAGGRGGKSRDKNAGESREGGAGGYKPYVASSPPKQPAWGTSDNAAKRLFPTGSAETGGALPDQQSASTSSLNE